MLTRSLYDTLMYIHTTLKETGIAPSYREIQKVRGFSAHSAVHYQIRRLEQRGFIRRLPGRPRAIEVIKLPPNHPEAPGVAWQEGNYPLPQEKFNRE